MSGRDTIASQITSPEPQLERVADDADDVATTGPTGKYIPAVAAAPVDDDATIE
jgi:hypothetical protein